MAVTVSLNAANPEEMKQAIAKLILLAQEMAPPKHPVLTVKTISTEESEK